VKNLLYHLAREQVRGKKKEKKEDPGGKLSVTHQAITIDGRELKFTATCGYMKIKGEEDKVKGSIFFTSYELDGVEEMSARPITFCFNGGPGCSSMWLHFASIGPKRVGLTEKGNFLPPPGTLIDNEYTWLQFTDLVFIDPVGTGYSRPGKDQEADYFYGVKEDLESVGEFIRLYITKHKRWTSPKFVAGESYGTTRAAGLSGLLQDSLGVDLNGIVLISAVLDFQTIQMRQGNDLPYVLFLPSYTATAWYHGKLSPAMQKDLPKTLKEVEEWAMTTYLTALAKGDGITPEEKDRIAERLSACTGVSKTFAKVNNLRIPQHRFCKELLREDSRTAGRLDSRFKGIETDPAGEAPEYDPSFFKGPFVTAVNDYVRNTLKYENDLPYTPMSPEVNHAWKWNYPRSDYPGFLNVAEVLQKELNRNPYLQVLVACGYYDLATPYLASIYTANHLGLEEDRRDRVSLTYYESGHMMYYHRPSLVKFTKDTKDFYQRAMSVKAIEID
jgi:carboxypeptidase C (cathepsin A)